MGSALARAPTESRDLRRIVKHSSVEPHRSNDGPRVCGRCFMGAKSCCATALGGVAGWWFVNGQASDPGDAIARSGSGALGGECVSQRDEGEGGQLDWRS